MAPLRGPFPYKTLALTPALALPTGGRKRRRGRAELADFEPDTELVNPKARAHVRERARRPGAGGGHGLRKMATGGAQGDPAARGRG